SDVEALAEHVQQVFGRLDCLINNAGGSARTPLALDDVSQEDFDRVMDVNVRSTFLMCKSFMHILEKSSGSIVNFGSIAGRTGLSMTSVQYSAAKAAVIGMTRTL